MDRDSDDLVKRILGDFLAEHEAKVFGGLLATQLSPDGDRPLVHARLLSELVARPLCGAADGPWSARSFDFSRLTCHECQSVVLTPPQTPD
jgi:hypothetical protein